VVIDLLYQGRPGRMTVLVPVPHVIVVELDIA